MINNTNKNFKKIRSFDEVYEECKPTFIHSEKIRILCIIITAIIEIGLVYLIYILHKMNHHNIALISLMVLSWFFINKGVEIFVKTEVMQTFVQAFGNFTWDYDPKNNDIMDSIINSKIIPPSTKRNLIIEDQISGQINNSKIYITKTSILKSIYTFFIFTFFGLVVSIDLNKNIDGEIIIVEKNFKPKTKLKQTKLEDIEWNSKFDVYTDNPIDARYFLTTALMERIKAIKKNYNAKFVHLYVKNKQLLVAINTGVEPFKTCSLIYPVKDKISWGILYHQIRSIIQLYKYFE